MPDSYDVSLARQLMRTTKARLTKLPKNEVWQIADMVAWQMAGADIVVAAKVFQSEILAAEYAFGIRQRRNKYTPRGSVPAGSCNRHPDRHGVYIIDGVRFCRACGVTLRRRRKKDIISKKTYTRAASIGPCRESEFKGGNDPMAKPVAVLGAMSPETVAIKDLLAGVGIQTHLAMHKGKPVTPGNAYNADEISPPLPESGPVWRVECNAVQLIGRQQVVVVDHHHPGDPGYGMAPSHYWHGSSLGQIYALLTDLGYRQNDPIPEEHLLIAASDHCLEAAYRGLCPGVLPERLMAWRAKSRAEFQKRSVDSVLADIEAARKILRENYNPESQYADLRGRYIPELPEAAAREGIPFIAEMRGPDGRVKIVMQAAPFGLIERFLRGEIIPGLSEMYGDPARGFAGGYKQA